MQKTDEGAERDCVGGYHSAEECYREQVVKVHLPEVVSPRLHEVKFIHVFDKVAELDQRVR